MIRLSDKRSHTTLGLIAVICGCLLTTRVSAGPFPPYAGPGHPGFFHFGHAPGVFAPHNPWSGALLVFGVTVATLAILDRLDERQRRLHETAQVSALSANVGERIVWVDGEASGSVTTVRRGADSAGRECREFRQTVTIGDKTELAYGTACRRSDGSWQIVR